MKKDDRLLEYMQIDVADILEFVKELASIQDMLQNKVIYKAVCMSIINLGQEAYELSDEFKRKNGNIPWTDIINMRNRTAHGYHLIDPAVVWQICEEDIPALSNFLKELANHPVPEI